MRRASVAAAGFAVTEGRAAEPSEFVHVSPVPDRSGRVLLACVEPLERTPRGMELAQVALRVMRETFAATPGRGAEALAAAFAAANAAILAENRPLTTGRWGRRICVGATAIALNGREIVVAQAAPSQAILVQDGQVYAFPEVGSWRGDYVPEGPEAASHPLGFVEDQSPRLYYSEAAPGDLIALCATSVGRALARDEDAVVELYGGSLLTEDLEGSVDRLERLLARHEVVDGFAVVASVSRLPRRAGPRLPLPSAVRPATASSQTRQVAMTWAEGGDPRAPQPPLATVPTIPEFVNPPPPAFEGARELIITAAEFIAARRRKREPAFDMRQYALAAPGALSVSRYRDTAGLPPEWRANLPRGPMVHVPARLLAVSLLLFAMIGGTGFAVGWQRDREARVASSLAAVDTALQHALDNPVSATSLIAEAETALASARDAGATGEALASREDRMLAVRDTAWKIQRLTNVVRVGALPGGGGGPVRMAISGQTVYLAAGNLYELDPDAGRLVTLLSKGQAVAGGEVGDLRAVSLDDGTLIAADGEAIYVRDKNGTWARHELLVADVGGLRADVPLVSWGDATYGLSWEGNIVRFEQTSAGPLVDTWAKAEEWPDLELARDMAIDGRIHLLLQDGRTVTFSRGEQLGTLSPFVTPTLTSAAFLAQAPFATAFYIVDPSGRIGENTGRVVRVNADGEARQILTPAPEPGDLMGEAAAVALAAAQDMVIDELTGAVFWVSGGEIWQATLPLS